MQNEYIDLPSGNLPYATKQEVRFMDLLNEYLAKYYAEHGNKNLYIELEWWSLFNVHETVVISRRFWFIKRLVDNHKIDLDKLKDNATFTAITHCIWIWRDWRTVKEWESIMKAIWIDAIIAYLSIQDSPIEFLISILK